MASIDVEATLEKLTIDEKIMLLAGKSSWSTAAVERLGIPEITTSDGPHGVRGDSFFNGPAGMLLPSATAMGATFDRDLIYRVGQALATEAKEKKCNVILGPTVCLQRSPLLGRGFEAFSEDPYLSGAIASVYIDGAQKSGVGCSIKHYVAHDQSIDSTEDDVRASERTLREMHLLPFQIAVKNADPWSIMTAYNKVNGTHVPEHPWLLKHVLREDWAWEGVTMSDWCGTYSCSDAINAGLDLEMPGPSRWRGDLLKWAITSNKVQKRTLDKSVRRILHLVKKAHAGASLPALLEAGDSAEKQELCRRVAADSIVLLKNERALLPLDRTSKRSYGLIGPAVHHPAISGGGSADLPPYHVSTPYKAFAQIVGDENIATAVGCRAQKFTTLLSENISIPGTSLPGYLVEWYTEDPAEAASVKPYATVETIQAQMFFADNLPKGLPSQYWLHARTTYTAPKTCTIEIGLSILGKGKLFVNGEQKIDLYSKQPAKTMPTPMFSQASMEVRAEIQVVEGSQYDILVYMKNESITAAAGASICGGLRIGCWEKLDREDALREAVELAKKVDVPVVIAGLNSDYESEAVDRKSLDLPPAVDDLILSVVKANPKTVVVTQSGCPILMPWLNEVHTLAHAWFGGQETGAAIANVLFGETNPCGRLSLTFPRRLEDTPAFLTFGKGQKEIFYGEGVFVGYRYYEKLKKPPLFYFGKGLSYTTFEYSNLQVPRTFELTRNNTFDITVDVRNTGNIAGYEVVQVYVADPVCCAPRPVKEFKGFSKVWIEPGKSVTVGLKLDKYALSFWSEDEQQWLAERGIFDVIIGRSADPNDEVLRGSFELTASLLWSGL